MINRLQSFESPTSIVLITVIAVALICAGLLVGELYAASMFGLLFASISTIVRAGFVVGTGILLDTFLVRTIAVPAMAVLVGRANWWPSDGGRRHENR